MPRAPSRNSFGPTFGAGFGIGVPPPSAIPVTIILCVILAVVSIIGTLIQQEAGMGLNLLNYQVDGILRLELWRLLTFPFVESTMFGFLMGLLVLWLFGGWFEATYGRRDYLRFFFVSNIGAALIAVPLNILFGYISPFAELGVAEGPDPAINAMLVAMAYNMPNATVLLIVFPMRARTMILWVIGLELLQGIYNRAAGLSMTLAGLLMGYLLVTGYWRPSRLLGVFRLTLLKRRRRSLYVVPPKDRTLN